MTATPTVLQIDFVSDVVCPWCAIGLHALEQAQRNLAGEISLQWHLQPFELHPDMAPEGQEIFAYLGQKYGMGREQLLQSHATIAQRGAEVGFVFDNDKRTHTFNTLNAHRLLHWLAEEGSSAQALALKHALFSAYFTHGENPGDPAVLVRLVAALGLDSARAQAILESDAYTDQVRAREQYYRDLGIHSVPAVIVNGRHLIQGGQPVAVFEQVLRQIAAGQG